MSTKSIPATPCKLRSGAWGARTAPSIRVGDVVTITARAGKTWDARVITIVWAGDDAAIVATESLDRHQPSAHDSYGCSYCRPTATRTAQIWEECDRCGAEPIYI